MVYIYKFIAFNLRQVLLELSLAQCFVTMIRVPTVIPEVVAGGICEISGLLLPSSEVRETTQQ